MDVKLNIHFIQKIENLSTEQLFSICEYYEIIDPNICLISDLKNDESLIKKSRAQVVKLKEVKEATQKQRADSTDCDILPIRFCFDNNSKFICLNSKLSSGTHKIVLPEYVVDQVNNLKSNLIYSDHVKLLTQACAITPCKDGNPHILLPWYVLSTVQLLMVAKLFKVDVSASAFLQHKSTLDNFVKPLCASSEAFLSKGYSMNEFDSTLFAFTSTNIFQCNYAVLPKNGSFTAIVSEIPMQLNSDSWTLMDDNPSYGKLSRSLRSTSSHHNVVANGKSAIKKVISVGSTETFTVIQLNSIISHFGLDIKMAGKKNLTLLTRKFFLSQFYQQQLIHSPLDVNIYCFDGQSNFVCMFQELKAAEHEIIVTSKQRELYDFETLVPDYDDLKKMLLHHYLSQTNYVLELPWIALTKSQMLAITKDKCPGLNKQKVLASKNIAGLLSGTLKQSTEYKNHFKDASKFDACLTFGISVEDPLSLCGWSVDCTIETSKKVAMYKELFGRPRKNQSRAIANSSYNAEQSVSYNNVSNCGNADKDSFHIASIVENMTCAGEGLLVEKPLGSLVQDRNICQKQSAGQTNTTKESSLGSEEQMKDHQHSEDSCSNTDTYDSDSESVLNMSSSVSSSEVTNLISGPREHSNDINSTSTTPEDPTDSKYNTCTGLPSVDAFDNPLYTPCISIKNDRLSVQKCKKVLDEIGKSHINPKLPASLETIDDSEISLGSLHSFKSPNCTNNVSKSTHPDMNIQTKKQLTEKSDVTTFCSSTPIRSDLLPSISEFNTATSGTDFDLDQKCSKAQETFMCAECNEKPDMSDILECFACSHKVHFCCYKQETTGKPLPNSYHNIAMKHLNNHKWFCNECTELPRDEILDKMCARQLTYPPAEVSEQDATDNFSSSHDTTTNNKILTEYNNQSTLEKILSSLNLVLKHQELLESSIKKSTEDKKWCIKRHKNSIKAILANTELLCERPNSYNLVEDIDKEVRESREILNHTKENVKITSDCVQELSSVVSAERTTYNEVKHSLYSSKIANTDTQYQVKPSTPVKATVDPRRTIVISKDIDKNIAQGSGKIKSAFNALFKNMNIKHCFVSKAGSIFIELTSEEDALAVQNLWKKENFTSPHTTSASTACTLFATIQNSIVLKGVTSEISDDELNEILNSQYPGAKAKRFIRRDGTRLSTIKVDFSELKHKQSALDNGVKIENTIISPENYIPKQRIIQCYNCFKYGHVAKLCHQKHPTCQICAGNHSQDDCYQQSTKCRNCLSAHHFATSKDCPFFQEAYDMIQMNNLKNKQNSQQLGSYDF